MSNDYWQATAELHRKDGGIETTPAIAMNIGFQNVINRAIKAYGPSFKGADQLLLIAIAKQNHAMLDAMRDSMPEAFVVGAEVPVRQLVAAIAAQHNFSSVIDWLHDQGLDPTESYPAIDSWEEIQPWREALIKGHLETITAFTDKRPTLLSSPLPLLEDDSLSPIALMCANKRLPQALQLVESTPGLIDVVCHFAGEPMDAPSYLDRLGHPDAATALRSFMTARAARLAIDSIAAERAQVGVPS